MTIQATAKIVELLAAGGYVPLEGKLSIGTLQFTFTATLVGTKFSHDLVIVVDTIGSSDGKQYMRQLEALGRALDFAASRRSVTVILVGPDPGPDVTRRLARTCRVLSVGTPVGERVEQELRDRLAVLLPLNIPSDGMEGIRPLDQLRERIEATARPAAESFIESAAVSPAAVRRTLRATLLREIVGVSS